MLSGPASHKYGVKNFYNDNFVFWGSKEFVKLFLMDEVFTKIELPITTFLNKMFFQSNK